MLFNQVALCNIVFLLNYSFLKLQIMLEAIRTYALRTPSCHPVLLLTITNFTLHYIAPINHCQLTLHLFNYTSFNTLSKNSRPRAAHRCTCLLYYHLLILHLAVRASYVAPLPTLHRLHKMTSSVYRENISNLLAFTIVHMGNTIKVHLLSNADSPLS